MYIFRKWHIHINAYIGRWITNHFRAMLFSLVVLYVVFCRFFRSFFALVFLPNLSTFRTSLFAYPTNFPCKTCFHLAQPVKTTVLIEADQSFSNRNNNKKCKYTILFASHSNIFWAPHEFTSFFSILLFFAAFRFLALPFRAFFASLWISIVQQFFTVIKSENKQKNDKFLHNINL